MRRILSVASVLFLSACSSGFSEKNGAYHYQGRDNIILSFAQGVEVTPALLKDTAALVDALLKDAPAALKTEKLAVEGLGADSFYNLFLLGDALFLGGVKPYQNKTLVYAFLASVYDKFLAGQKRHSPVPLADFAALSQGAPSQDISRLNSYIVTYAVNEIFFVSILEMLDRPQRYFYPAKTKEELFRTLFYPELLGFWDYMAVRYGAGKLFAYALNEYSPEGFEVEFAEKISDVEGAFVEYAKKNAEGIVFSPPEYREKLDSLLNLYMTGTKKSLMTE